jgi:hypothetical protein
MGQLFKTIFWLSIFSIAMGYMESAVVVYLRKIYYPGGFDFPLIPVSRDVAVTEFWREAATIIMLVGMGVLAGKSKVQRFAFFIYCFAIWDLFYYVFLKLLLDWPGSLLSWDILFLIPVPWVGPVLAPCIVSLTMILLAALLLYHDRGTRTIFISFFEWMLLISGSITLIISMMWDYIRYLSVQGTGNAAWTLSSDNSMFEEVSRYVPAEFNWWLFCTGEALILSALVLFQLRNRSENNSNPS